ARAPDSWRVRSSASSCRTSSELSTWNTSSCRSPRTTLPVAACASGSPTPRGSRSRTRRLGRCSAAKARPAEVSASSTATRSDVTVIPLVERRPRAAGAPGLRRNCTEHPRSAARLQSGSGFPRVRFDRPPFLTRHRRRPVSSPHAVEQGVPVTVTTRLSLDAPRPRAARQASPGCGGLSLDAPRPRAARQASPGCGGLSLDAPRPRAARQASPGCGGPSLDPARPRAARRASPLRGGLYRVLASCLLGSVLAACHDLGLPDVSPDGGAGPDITVRSPREGQTIPLNAAVNVDAASVNGVSSVTVTCGGAPSTGVFTWNV